MPDQDPCHLPSFNGVCAGPRIACLYESRLHQDDRVPLETEQHLPTQGSEETDPSQWNVPLQISVSGPHSRDNKTQCPHYHSLLVHGKHQDYCCVFCFPHLCLTGCVSLSSQPSTWSNRSHSWSFKCINTWGSTFVHPAKVGFSVNNFICCLRHHFFVSPTQLSVGYMGDGTSQ